jgi:carboxyl-terminal processing protease
MRLLPFDKDPTATRAKILQCIRHLQQQRRHQDRHYVRRISELPLSRALNAYVDALGKIQANYVERDKIALTDQFQRGLDEVAFALSEPAFCKLHVAPGQELATSKFTENLREQWQHARMRHSGEVRDAVRNIALSAQKELGITPSIVVLEFLCGACNALDEHSAYIPPSEQTAIYSGQLTAHGVQLNSSADGSIFIERVLPGTWAAAAELREGDRIVRFIGKNCEHGEPEQLMEIEVAGRSDAKSRTIKMPVLLSSVHDISTSVEGVAFLRISGFTRTTVLELQNAFTRLRMDGAKALIVDLRGNPGGLFPVAVDVAEQFLPEGIIVTTQGQGAAYNRNYESRSGMGALDLPLLVLVDQDTASAAEVLAGALKENQRATLIGRTTYGKGTIQNVMQLSAGGGMRITLARFFAPNGQPYQGVGVTPNIQESIRPRELAHELAVKSIMMRND